MKHLLRMFGMARLLAVAITAILSVGMWGCSDRVEFKWSDSRGTPSIAGFIDDSLVVAYDCRGWLETTETWNGGYSEDESCGHDRLLVFNYRVQEDGPRWTDSLTNKSGGYHWYQLTDSVFWRWEGKNILLWKIGETAHEMKVSRKNEGCSHTFEIDRMHQWLDGTFIALGGNLSVGGDSCQYAVLDTIEKTLIFKRLGEDLAWIKMCDDVRAWGEEVYCMGWNEWHREGVLRRNQDDTLALSFEFGMGAFWGDVIELGGRFCALIENRILCAEDVLWVRPLKFKRYDEVILDLSE